MSAKIKTLGVVLIGISLSACMTDYDSRTNSYQNYHSYSYDTMPPYPSNEAYSNDASFNYRTQAQQSVTVPESYHVGSFHSPVAHKDQDKNWVAGQNPQSYTIEIANDEKASQVANKLLRTPKTQRAAEIKYQQNGKPYYKGVYGSFQSQEEAQQALNALPEEVKTGANIQSWGTVQSNITP